MQDAFLKWITKLFSPSSLEVSWKNEGFMIDRGPTSSIIGLEILKEYLITGIYFVSFLS